MFALGSNPDANSEDIYRELLDEDNNDSDLSYLNELVDGVLDHQSEIDMEITKYLRKNWNIGRLNKTDLIILRIAIFEIKYSDVASKIAVNEAVELAKEFSDDKSYKFVNAILQNLI
ncbi:transcription antitermination factor NusB [Ligilactobacillus salivarius GJ-24]|uniref:Transcription antitermination factor NusB n=1 Tax=Ligilactobacillus salivarius GJ-24 TaxID=1041521 RepID=F7QW10_9LACO|nr:transcription antitermination factor NusB [Ligilactobacillus salivarius GJ-24]